MANRSTAIDGKTAKALFAEVEAMQKSLDSLRKKVLKYIPVKYGSDLWWEKEELEADEDIRVGRVFGPFENVDQLLNSLHKEVKKNA